MTPGTVIRQSGDDRKVLSNVRDHDFLLSDKTAAVKTNLDERLKALEEELEHNMADPVRERESDLFDQLVGTGFDIKKVRQVRKTVSSRRELDQFANLDNTFVEIKADLAGTTEALSSLISKRQRLTDDLELISYEIDAAEARKQQAKLHEESSLARIFRFIARRRKTLPWKYPEYCLSCWSIATTRKLLILGSIVLLDFHKLTPKIQHSPRC